MKTFLKIVVVLAACVAAVIALNYALSELFDTKILQKYVSTDSEDEELPFN